MRELRYHQSDSRILNCRISCFKPSLFFNHCSKCLHN